MEIQFNGENGSMKIIVDEVFGFPNNTTHIGGYDCQCTLILENEGFLVEGIFYSSTGQFYQLYESLKIIYDKLDGNVKYINSYEDNLKISFNMNPKFGTLKITGEYYKLSENNIKLIFDIDSNQSYLKNAIQDLKILYNKYGGMTGIIV